MSACLNASKRVRTALGGGKGERATGDESMLATENALLTAETANHGEYAEELLLAYPNSHRQSRCANYAAGGGCV